MSVLKDIEMWQKEARNAPNNYTPMSAADLNKNMDILFEEFEELKTAVSCADYTEILDANLDIIYVAIGFIVNMGIDPEAALEEVQKSNDSKRDLNGTLVKNAKGKVIKGGNYIPPDLSRFLK